MTDLTGSETNLLRMIAGGMTSAEIAFALDTSEIAVASNIADILSKLKAQDIEAAVTAAVAAGLLSVVL